MADGGTGEKTEEPTPERLRKLRKEGNVPKSQDITIAVSFLGVFCVLAGVFGFITQQMFNLFDSALLAASMSDELGTAAIHGILLEAMKTMFMVCGPALGAAFVLGISLNVAQVGFMFTLKPITPDIKKINPVNGIKNLINKKKLVELLKTVLKFVVIGWLSYVALRHALRDVVMIVRSELTTGVAVVGSIVWDFCIKIGAVFFVIAAFDAFYQKKRYIKENRMSKYDVKQEYKQSEGDPQMKGERKRLHQEILNDASPQNVKQADVVVRNPDHIAVALKYDKEEGGAPEIVAKGNRIWADQILDAAKRYGVPVVRNVPLAQALDKLDVGDEIPEELFEAVAEVLNFVLELAESQKRKG
ncbi:MAG: EscU/YscU/HrcU family type III secretion system export apparatus switch protein [Myxococcota bacterium]